MSAIQTKQGERNSLSEERKAHPKIVPTLPQFMTINK